MSTIFLADYCDFLLIFTNLLISFTDSVITDCSIMRLLSESGDQASIPASRATASRAEALQIRLALHSFFESKRTNPQVEL